LDDYNQFWFHSLIHEVKGYMLKLLSFLPVEVLGKKWRIVRGGAAAHLPVLQAGNGISKAEIFWNKMNFTEEHKSPLAIQCSSAWRHHHAAQDTEGISGRITIGP